MRPVAKGPIPKNVDGTDVIFKEYAEAKRFLIDRIEKYCSYCETHINANLAVEHVRPKKKVPTLELVWDNFLLACSSCNSTKGDDDLVLADYFWPDKDDTFSYFLYDDSGLVKVQNDLSEEEKTKAAATIKLTGLDKPSPKPNTREYNRASDLRVEHRLEAWQKANTHLKNYEAANEKIRPQLTKYIVEVVVGFGFWSIWMMVFKSHLLVRSALINDILGTNKTYFQNPV